MSTPAQTPVGPLPPSEGGRRARFVRAIFGRLPRRIQVVLRASWQRYLHILAWRPWVRDIVAPALFVAIGRAIALPFQGQLPETINRNVGLEIAYDLAILFASVSFVRWSATWGVPAMMSHVRQIALNTQEPRRDILRQLGTEQLREINRIVEGLTHGGYTVQSPAALKPWFARFFAAGGGMYIGVDSHRPATFMSQYEWYLDAHERNLESRGHPQEDKRILATPRNAISDDFRFSYAAYQRFDRWHQDNFVRVSWLSDDAADILRARHGVDSVDVGLWKNFAVLFSPETDGAAITLKMYFPREPERDGTTYERIAQYVHEANTASKDLGEVAPRLELVDRELAGEWENYVAPDLRARGLPGSFLLDVLRDKHYIFDAAAGIACDSVFLITEGFQVYTNEVDSLLAGSAAAYAQRHKVELQLSTHLWETLPESLPGNFRFDAILCLGNSLCLVEDSDGRARCIAALRDTLLREDSMLIIDERNFQYMLDHAREIRADPISAFPPTTRGDVMYQGTTIRGYPAEIDPAGRLVTWRFFRNRPPVGSLADIEEASLRSADLVLHAFEHGELFGLLKDAGFQSIRTFADLVEVTSADGMPPPAAVGDAAFITYVASRGPTIARRGREDHLVGSPASPGA